MMIDVIGFDADDTLWGNEFIYHQAKQKFGDLFARVHAPDKTLSRLDTTEVDNIVYYGYGIKSFGLSMIETALDMIGYQITVDELRKLIDIVKEMLLQDVPLVDTAVETLESLSSEYSLMLITKGDLYEQERKIARSGLNKYFQYIEVVGEKTMERYLGLLSKYSIDPARFLMVGNSLRSDILPVVKIGGKAVYIPNDQTWFHEEVQETDIGGLEFGKIEHLGQLPGYIKASYG